MKPNFLKVVTYYRLVKGGAGEMNIHNMSFHISLFTTLYHSATALLQKDICNMAVPARH